jgi:hypothetical protein
MFFDIGIGIHLESQLNMFHFVDDISSKMEVFSVSEILGGRNFMQNRNFIRTCKHDYLSLFFCESVFQTRPMPGLAW